MTDGRYDSRRGEFDPQRSSNDRYDRSSRDDRGFFDRARDEVSSWFGDDDAERRRDRDDRFQDSNRSDNDGRFGRERGQDRFEQPPRNRDEGSRRPYPGPAVGGQSDHFERSPTGQNFDRGIDSGQNFDRGQSQREPMRASSASSSQGRHDSDYSQWRSRQIDELDRDYDEYRRENQSRFDSEFSTWRGQRQTKRQLLGQVTEHMEVVGSDDLPLGKVDAVKGDKIILTKSDSPDGRHHSIACNIVDRIEDNKVFLTRPAEEARREFGTPDRDRALGERDDQGEDGPHVLNRSFSGTY
ncbi:MAG: DUF2171 domain-containing protein [Sphingomonas bacterium]|nr:DUF2171 domain-containing protein [Sphingomonas bacterium]